MCDPRSSLRRLGHVASAWLIAIGTAAATATAAEPAAVPRPPTGPMLHLAGGEFLAGELKEADRADVLRWQGTSFASPFEFFLDRVQSVQWPPPATRPKPIGDYCLGLAGGDVLFGSLIDLNETEAVLDASRIGRVRVRRNALQRIDRWRSGADLVFWGPNGLADWRESSPTPGWREDSGLIETDKPGATIRGDLGLPARAAVEFELSWKNTPDFVLALGVDVEDKSARSAFRFEIWDGELVALRETEREADPAPLLKVSKSPGRERLQAVFRGQGQRPVPKEVPEPGRIHLLAFLDQERGRMSVFSPDGKRLAEVEVAEPSPKVRTGVLLANLRTDLKLERLRIGRWNGTFPREATAGTPRVQADDGSIVAGDVTRFDPATKEFVVKGEGGESRLAEDRVAGISFANPDDARHREVRAVAHDGVRLGGSLVKVEHGEVWLDVPGIKDPVRLLATGLRSLLVLQQGHDKIPVGKGERTGRLEIEGARLTGRLVDGREQPGASCLTWQPLMSATASPLRPGVSGRIVYKETPAPQPPQSNMDRQAKLMPQGVVFMAGGVVRRVNPAQPQPEPPVAKRPSLHLRTGDIIPSEVTKIDEDGVTFRSPVLESTFVPHDKVIAVELAPESAPSVRLTKSKRDRLLTLPRMQKDSPPTQLIRSKNGDYLRGRVLAMDDRTLQVEVRLETKDLPRDRVSRIIWLYPEEAGPPKEPATPAGGEGSTRVQAVCSDGIRLTFSADRVAGATLSGRGDVLGVCRVRLVEVDQLLIGGAIEKAAAQLAYQQWKLKNAPEPKEAPADGGSSPDGQALGTESPLVGKPAPDFELDLLAGKKFHLAETKGQVVVLDFWATWCGPCMQAMPQVERVADEFKDRGVRLVAVNLQETPEQITGVLERHKLHPAVALDREGVVAEKYKANAIPQTVIIDRDGNVSRLFVGGGPHFDDQLREALRSLFPADKPDADNKK